MDIDKDTSKHLSTKFYTFENHNKRCLTLETLSLDCLTNPREYRKCNLINVCFLPAKFDINKQKSGSKPLFSLFKVDLDKYMETI